MESHTIETQQIGRSAASLGLGLILSRLMGLLRDMLFAFILGGGVIADIFFAAFRLPHFCRRLVQEGALALSFIPLFNKVRANSGKTAAFDFSRAAMWKTLVLCVILVLLCVYAANGIMVVIAPGFVRNAPALEAASGLFSIMLFYVPCMALAGLASCVLLALNRYRCPALSPAVFNGVMILSAFGIFFLGYSGLKAAWILSIALVVGGLVQFLFQIPSLRAEGYRVIGPLRLNSFAGKAFIRRTPLAALGAASYQLGVLIAMFFASYLTEGSVAALYFAERLLEMPFNVVGVAIGTASLNTFSRLALEERQKEFARHLYGTISFSLFLLIPATFGLLVLGYPIVETFFGHGAFSGGAIERTVVALTFYAPGLPAVAVMRPLLAAINARGQAFTSSVIAILSLILLVILALLLVPVMDLAGVALSGAIAAWFNLLLLVLLLRRAIHLEAFKNFIPWRNTLVFLLFSLAMFAVLMLLNLAGQRLGLNSAWRLAAGIPIGLLVYMGLCSLTHRPELSFLIGTLRGKKMTLYELDDNN